MARVLIIADDLTGANANCALMKTIGLRTASLTGTVDKKKIEDIDVVALATDSRSMTGKQAYKSVYDKVRAYMDGSTILYSKRIDSTLRGNLGSELMAFQEALADNRMAICVPAFPDSKRIVVNDFLYVDGSPVMNTDAGKDTKASAISNFVTENFRKDYDRSISHITIEEIEKGLYHISSLIRANKDKGLLIFDAITNRQIELIAAAALDSGIDFISVDPGPFTKELTKLIYSNNKISTKALAIIGSATQVTINQIKELEEAFKPCRIDVDANKLIDIDSATGEIERASSLGREKLKEHNLLLITTTPKKIEDRLDLKTISEERNMSIERLSLMISGGLAQIGRKVAAEGKSFSGIFSSGGDVTVAVTKEFGSHGIEIREEIEPLVAYGRLIGGALDGLKIVSKGGMVGSDKVMLKCIDRLMSKGDKGE